MRRDLVKKENDLQIITQWVTPGAKVLDLGCGRGILLEEIVRRKSVYAVGVDSQPVKIESAIRRGVNIVQGDMTPFLAEMPDQFYDWVILSRTVQELQEPARIIKESLRVGRHLVVGFVNHAFWLNRTAMLFTGSRVTNDVFPLSWEEGSPYNPVTILGFESFCEKEGLTINRRLYLRGDWQTPCKHLPNLLAGYALYELEG